MQFSVARTGVPLHSFIHFNLEIAWYTQFLFSFYSCIRWWRHLLRLMQTSCSSFLYFYFHFFGSLLLYIYIWECGKYIRDFTFCWCDVIIVSFRRRIWMNNSLSGGILSRNGILAGTITKTRTVFFPLIRIHFIKEKTTTLFWLNSTKLNLEMDSRVASLCYANLCSHCLCYYTINHYQSWTLNFGYFFWFLL